MVCKSLLKSIMVVACVSGPVWAGPMVEYKIDGGHSSVVFKVMNHGVNFVYGRFNELEGTLSVDDKKEPKKLTIAASVEAKSIDTNDKGRDKHLKDEDFFNSKKFKTIAFKTKESKKLEGNKFELTGELTLLEKTLPLTVVFDITGSAKSERGGDAIGGETTFTIKRSEWGMTKALEGIADEVIIMVSIQAKKDVAPAG